MALNEWITASDAVHAVHLSLGCNHDAAGQILLAFTKGANVDALFTGYYVEDLEEGEDEYAPKLTGSLSPEDWKAFFISNSATCDFDWVKNRLTFKSVRITKEDKTIPSKITRYDDIRFSRSSLKHLLMDEKQRRGPKFGDFWPLLAEEVAVYIHEEGAPDQVGVAKGRAAIRQLYQRSLATSYVRGERVAWRKVFEGKALALLSDDVASYQTAPFYLHAGSSLLWAVKVSTYTSEPANLHKPTSVHTVASATKPPRCSFIYMKRDDKIQRCISDPV